MEDTVIVIMLKNIESGFLEKEIGCYTIDKNDELIYNIYAVSENGAVKVRLRLSVERDLEDWEFNAVFDYYDTEVFTGLCESVTEDDTNFNPVWELVFDFNENDAEMEEILGEILGVHKAELTSVYEAIEDQKDEYSF